MWELFLLHICCLLSVRKLMPIKEFECRKGFYHDSKCVKFLRIPENDAIKIFCEYAFCHGTYL